MNIERTMLRLIFIHPDGTETMLSVPPGTNIMDVAVKNDIDGISANCRGNCACSTCHVYVEPDWLERVGAAAGMEEDILDFAPDARPGSRLSCQLVMSEALDGLRLRIPDWQRWN
ncbi:2Fe-2S iron-sulfur cluster-binding protein [Parvibaculum sp.]|uniref:2Fe-2S iron-sulfur cluster-binding protein n=1 Tax=Parvibaculum sp. TaxID=2024848 RepID=UPI003BAB003B